jgi:hypothetical protein
MSTCNDCSTLAHGFITMRSAQGAYFARRKHLPAALYILVPDEPTTDPVLMHDIVAPRNFTWKDLTMTQITSHLLPQSVLTHTSPFLSAHSDPSRTLACLPLASNWTAHSNTMDILRISTKDLVPAWAYTQSDEKIPIWIEKSSLPQLSGGGLSMMNTSYDTFESACWICVDEVKYLLGPEQNNPGKGEWLACGYVPARMICTMDDGEELDLWTESAKGASVVGGRWAWMVEMERVPARTSSLLQRRAKQKPKEDLKIQQSKETDKSTIADLMGTPQHTTPPIQPVISVAPPAHNPQRPKSIPSTAEVLDSALFHEYDGHPSNDLPPTVAIRDFATIPSITVTSPSPSPRSFLLYSAIAITSPQSTRSAATLARLEDIQLTGAALRMWIEESRERHEAAGSKKGTRKS